MIADIERARRALQAIPPDVPRDEWVRVLMAGQAAGLDADELRAWSEQGNTYEARAFADTMRSIKPGKGIGAGTLHRLAAEHGQQSLSKAPIRPVVRPQTVRQGFAPADVWSRCKPATPSHRYVVRKLGGGGPELAKLRVLPEDDALRVAGQSMAGALAVPAFTADGTLQSLQLIPPEGKKMNLPGCAMAGASFTVGTPAPGEPLYLCEGIGQAWACWQATGRAAVCCFGWGNVATVAAAILKWDSAAQLVLVPDVGKEQDAEKIARELGCSVAFMPEGEPQNFDCNDLAQRDGADVLAALLEAAQDFAPVPLLVPVDVARVLSEPSEPPRFVWDGYLPRGVVAMLGAHGGTGKSTIALMLAVAVAAGRGELLGVACEPGRVVFASLEDSAAVVRHRLHKICTAWGIEPHALAQRLSIVDGTSEPELFASTGRDGGSTTPAYAELRALAQGCDLLMIDNASDAYGGDEIQRRQVRAFIRALAAIASESAAAVLLLAHVDKATSRARRAEGGEGYSGSTAWNNSVRSRLFMSRGDDGALVIEHQKSNLSKLREPLRLFWPDGGLPQVDAAPVGVVAHIADNVNTRALLKLIAEFSERGEHVSTATTSRSNAAALLSAEAGYPKALKPREVFDLLRRAERAGHIERVVQRTANRKPLECWQVTSKGREHAELVPTAPAAPTARFEEVGAPDAEGAPTAPTSAGGYRGRESAQEVGAPAGADAENDTGNCADFNAETEGLSAAI